MKINGWGNYPSIESEMKSYSDFSKIQDYVCKNHSLIPSGLFRSYGDSALSSHIFSSLKLNKFLKFDTENGIMQTEAGVSFEEINIVAIPKGWFLPVTPGTKYVTVGGAIASDVHGKNHHKSGTFGQFVNRMKIMLSDGTIALCSKTENSDLFYATIAGMGLTGIILEAEFSLQKIETSTIEQKTLKARNLDELINFFQEYSGYTYSVSWLDTASKGNSAGRALLYLGEHSKKNEFDLKYSRQNQIINLPLYLPNIVLNQFTQKRIILAYYTKEFKLEKNFYTNFDTFIYPLDAINNWNRGYGNVAFLSISSLFHSIMRLFI